MLLYYKIILKFQKLKRMKNFNPSISLKPKPKVNWNRSETESISKNLEPAIPLLHIQILLAKEYHPNGNLLKKLQLFGSNTFSQKAFLFLRKYIGKYNNNLIVSIHYFSGKFTFLSGLHSSFSLAFTLPI